MLLAVLMACAPEATWVGLCGPTGRFLTPEPDEVRLDGARRVQVEVLLSCTGGDPSVTWERGDDLDAGAIPMECAAAGDDLVRCHGWLDTDELAACSGEVAWTTIRLYAGGPDTGGREELDEVGIPFAAQGSQM